MITFLIRSSTTSLIDSAYNFQLENGRTYHSSRAGCKSLYPLSFSFIIHGNTKSSVYLLPNDPTENERMEYQHEIIMTLLEGKLHLAPLPTTKPMRILDVGTGTGSWAIEMAEMYPTSTIVGTDLSPIQPKNVPSNVEFLIDDAEHPDWAVPAEYYTCIHTRFMLGSFTDFNQIVNRAYTYLAPGGFLESQELDPQAFCDDKSMPTSWPYAEWTDFLIEAAGKAQRPLRIAPRLKQWYEDAGFVDVREEVFKIPIGPWPKDPVLKSLGVHMRENVMSGLQGFSLAFFTRVLGWSADEVEAYLEIVRKSLKTRKVHAYVNFHVVTGRKPYAEEVQSGEKR